MIQRIQSIYLFITALSMALISFKISIYQIGIKEYFAQEDSIFFVLTIVIMILSLFALALFKSRSLQMKFIRIAIVLSIVLSIRLILLYFQLEAQLSISCLIFVFFSILSLIMALRGVLKDEKLVRSADRIR
ncbi:MAG: hypothetical protein CMP57_02705 [Flavobacteriales bacterium]|nr:hypothetical protein [Flavobacteriales bacterium]